MPSEPRRSTDSKASRVICGPRIGRALRLRLAPEIAFKLDQSVAHAARIESLLAQIHDERPVDDTTPDSDDRTPPALEGRPIDGLLLVDKPAGVTSHDVVNDARRALRTRRIGHAGTLDPFATGLLVLLVGHATRLLPHLNGEPKVYRATIAFGAETDTDDVTGSVTRTAELARRLARARGDADTHRPDRPGSAGVFREAGRRPTRVRRRAPR